MTSLPKLVSSYRINATPRSRQTETSCATRGLYAQKMGELADYLIQHDANFRKYGSASHLFPSVARAQTDSAILGPGCLRFTRISGHRSR